MAQLIEAAEWTRYNANARGNNVGDCVCRSISFAFDIPYSTASKQLNESMKRERRNKWNIWPVYEPVIMQNGGSKRQLIEGDFPTVEEFADQNNQSCILILCGKSNSDSRTSHMVCIIDGRIYDSWDSREYYVKGYYICSGNRHVNETSLESNMEELTDEAYDLVYHELNRYREKWIDRGFLYVDMDISCVDLTYEGLLIKQTWKVKYTFSNPAGGELEDHTIRMKINIPLKPGMSYEDAKASIAKIGKQRSYDRMYAIRENVKKDKEAYDAVHDINDDDDAEVADQRWLFATAAEERFMKQLPGKVKPYISYIHIQNPGRNFNSYEIRIKRMPHDPNNDKEIVIEAYDSSAAKDMIKRYVEKFERPHVDYDPYEDY